ncbi:MAG: L,D-transpeptidase [Candidatus Coatesbacteria bacterium]|nr:MAG: L,D-transpeptidase [Candidatus Coatesbacteria bacterium]
MIKRRYGAVSLRLALAVAVGALLFSGCRGKAEDLPASAEETPHAEVKVVNAAGREAVCRELAVRLGLDGAGELGVEGYRDAGQKLDYSVEETVILADPTYRSQAEAIREKLGFGTIAEAPGLEVVEVVVGRDAAEPAFPEAPAEGVYVSKAEKAVYFYRSGRLTHIWPCAIGKPETPTPTGKFEVTTTIEKPTWYWKGKAIPPGPDNGLGDWFIGITKKGYGLHGTNEPPSIGTAASHGCIRMYNDHAGELVTLVSPGTPVVIAE